MEGGIEEILICCDFFGGCWARIRNNNAIGRLSREGHHYTLAVGYSPDGKAALCSVAPYELPPVERQEIYEYEAPGGGP